MKAQILIIILSVSFNGYSQNLPELHNFQYQADCTDKYMFGWYLSDSTFSLIIDDGLNGEYYKLTGKMTFMGNIVTLHYLENADHKFPDFEVGREEQLIIERHGEILVPTGEPYIICDYLYKAEVRY